MTSSQSKDTPPTGAANAAGDLIRDHMAESAAVKSAVADACGHEIERAAAMMLDCLARGGKLLFCGNGGSAADCQHIVAEFVSTLDHRRPRPGLAAIALTTDSSILTAYTNDFGFEGVFARQVEALGREGDLLVGISTSGNSTNVVAAMVAAKGQGLATVALTGRGGGRLGQEADVAIRVPSENTQHIQEAHIAIGHVLCALCEGPDAT